MAITTALCNSAKQGFLSGAFGSGDTYKVALYTSSATLGASTTAYSATNEVANGNGYTTGGATLSGYSCTITNTTTGSLDWTDPVWSNASITARGALLYKSGSGNPAIAVFDFGQDVTSTNGDFTVTLGSGTPLIYFT